MNEGFIFYRSFYDAIKDLPDDVRLQAYDAICQYGIDGDEMEVCGFARSILAMAKPQIDANVKRRENGKKGGKYGILGAGYGKLGGRPKTPQSPDTETPPNNPPKVKDKENDKDKEKEKGKENDKEKVNEKEKAIIAAWNDDPNLIHVLKVNAGSKRHTALKARLREYGKETILEAIEKLRASDFCHGGGSTGWVADFDWFLRPETITKILEGKYDNRQTIGKPDPYMDAIKNRVDVVDSWISEEGGVSA